MAGRRQGRVIRGRTPTAVAVAVLQLATPVDPSRGVSTYEPEMAFPARWVMKPLDDSKPALPTLCLPCLLLPANPLSTFGGIRCTGSEKSPMVPLLFASTPPFSVRPSPASVCTGERG